jgi:CheY-like chemotaxis protein
MSTHEMNGAASKSASVDGAVSAPTFPRRARVLIVDDMPENRLLLGLYCDQFGVAHESAANGYEALEAARSGRFDAILMDILMPRMDGMLATRAIRDLPGPVSATPIIAVTTAAEPGEVLRYLACGMTDVVAKPILVSRLAQALSAALAKPAATGGRRAERGAARRA